MTDRPPVKYTLHATPDHSRGIDYEKELNPAQATAALHGEGPLLIVAGAGTGKTRTLIYRVARLVELGTPPPSILLLTFTRRAADEMIRRASTVLDRRCESVSGGTFHSFAHTILRRHAAALGFPANFTILDRADSEDLVGLLRTEIGAGAKGTRFPKKETLADLFSRSVNREEDISATVDREAPHFMHLLDDILRLNAMYRAAKRERALMDYDDLLLHLATLLREHEGVRRILSDSHRHILVDEYQDTNRIQADIVRLLCATHDNAVAVGDDAQSIYSFRGARFRNMLDFPHDFPGAKVILLEENYRSVRPILDVTNDVIARAVEKYPKRLHTSRGGGDKPALVACPSERTQSAFVADRIVELMEERDVPLSEIAVLFRAAHLSFDLEIELGKRRIPYRKFGGFRFLETAHVKDVVSHLRLLENPKDTIALARALMLVPGIGKKAGADLSRAAYEAASLSPVVAGLGARKKSAGAAELAKLVAELGGEANGERGALTPQEVIARVIAYYKPTMEAKFDDHPRRLRDLEHLEALAARHRTLSSFLAEITLEPPNASVDDPAGTGSEDEFLTLSTIHSAKGLEWKAVFVIWTLDGKIPSLRSIDDPDDIEEERRLLYVAATRAKDFLVLSYPVNIYERTSGTVLSAPCRFLDGIPQTLLPRYALVE